MLLGRARFQKYHDTMISMLHDDIRFGVDIVEHEFQGDLRAFCSRGNSAMYPYFALV